LHQNNPGRGTGHSQPNGPGWELLEGQVADDDLVPLAGQQGDQGAATGLRVVGVGADHGHAQLLRPGGAGRLLASLTGEDKAQQGEGHEGGQVCASHEGTSDVGDFEEMKEANR
jgi:hypothetical protein